MRIQYVCEQCEKAFWVKEQCKTHERMHELERKLTHMPGGTVICPSCEGEGGYYGTDGVDWRCCGVCKGSGFAKKIVTYEAVE